MFVGWGSEKGAILHLSQNVVDILQRPRAEVIGSNIRGLLPRQIQSCFVEYVDSMIENGNLGDLLGERQRLFLMNSADQLLEMRGLVGIGFMEEQIGFMIELESLSCRDGFLVTLDREGIVENVSPSFYKSFLMRFSIDQSVIRQLDLTLMIPEIRDLLIRKGSESQMNVNFLDLEIPISQSYLTDKKKFKNRRLRAR